MDAYYATYFLWKHDEVFPCHGDGIVRDSIRACIVKGARFGGKDVRPPVLDEGLHELIFAWDPLSGPFAAQDNGRSDKICIVYGFLAYEVCGGHDGGMLQTTVKQTVNRRSPPFSDRLTMS